MRRAAKPDANQEAIRSALRQMGAVVIPCGQLENAWDFIAFYQGKIFIVEVKNPMYLPKNYDRKRLESALTTGEKACMEKIQKAGCDYHIICTVDEAITLVTS